MTCEQRKILQSTLEGEGGGYSIITIEYPSDQHGALKIVTRQAESDHCDVDVFNTEGRTVETRSYFAREVMT